MAKLIKFHIPKNFRNSFVRAAWPQQGKVIEFSSRAKKSSPARSAGRVLEWLLESTEPKSAS